MKMQVDITKSKRGGINCKLYCLLEKVKHFNWRIKRKMYYFSESGWNQKNKISHVTYYAVGNAGDTVLSQCVRRTFNFEKRNGWNLINVTDAVDERVITTINNTSALIIGGGGLFLPDTNKNSISGWQWAVSNNQLDSINVPIIVFAVGYNYFKGQEANDLFVKGLTKLCEKASFIGLRNQGSVRAIKELLPEELKERIRFQPCTTTIIRHIYDNQLPAKVKSNKVAINMAFDRSDRRYGNRKKEICCAVSKAMKLIEDMGFDIYLVYHCPEDSEFRPYLDEEGVNYVVKDLSYEFPKKVYEFYNGIHCVLGMRGHAQMIPFGMNCGIISLGTHDKMRWFLEDINMNELYVDITEDLDTLADRIAMKFQKYMISDFDKTQEKLIEAQKKLVLVTKENMMKIQNLL